MTSLSTSLALEREMNTHCGLHKDFGISDPPLFELHKHTASISLLDFQTLLEGFESSHESFAAVYICSRCAREGQSQSTATGCQFH